MRQSMSVSHHASDCFCCHCVVGGLGQPKSQGGLIVHYRGFELYRIGDRWNIFPRISYGPFLTQAGAQDYVDRLKEVSLV